MCESVEVLVTIDYENKICYTEEQTFAAGSTEARNAKIKYMQLVKTAAENGYQIIKREKSLKRG